MKITVTQEQVKDVFNEAKRQFIDISISNHSGQWSDQYFLIQDIKELKQSGEKITVLLLISPNDLRCIAINAKLIHGIRFNKYLNLNGQLSTEVGIVHKDSAPQLSHEIFSSSFRS